MKSRKLTAKTAVFALGVLMTLQGCAHSDLNKKIDAEVAQETTVKTRADYQAEASQDLQNAPGLSPQQRTELSQLRDTVQAKNLKIRLETLKLKSVLLKDLMAKDYNDDEVELIKQRISDLENKRISETLEAVEEASAILGHDIGGNRQELMDAFFEGRSGTN